MIAILYVALRVLYVPCRLRRLRLSSLLASSYSRQARYVVVYDISTLYFRTKVLSYPILVLYV